MPTAEPLQSPSEASVRANERSILFFTCAAHALTHLYLVVFTGVIDEMSASFEVDVTAMTFYASLSNILFGVGALPAGWLGDRIGEKRMLVAFFVITALGAAMVGIASSRWILAVGMIVLGAGTSIFHPVGNALISKSIRHPGKAMGINGLWGSLGTAAGPLIAVQVADLLSWRWSYLVLTGPTLAFGFWLARTRLDLSAAAPGATATPPGNAASDADTPPDAESDKTHRAVKMLVPLILAMMVGGVYFHMTVTMLPKYLSGRVPIDGVKPTIAGGYLTAALLAIGGVGQLLAGHFVHQREGRGLYCLVLVVAAPLLFSLSRLEGWPLFTLGCFMAIFIFAVQPIENVLLARYTPARMRGIVFGAKFVLAFGVGGLGTGLSGVVTKHSGIADVFVVASGFTALGLVLALVAWSVRVRPTASREAKA